MAEPIRGIDAARVRANLDRVRERCGPEVEILAAIKYVDDAELPELATAGVELVGENRLQDLERKQALHGSRFTWDFIGNLQSRKVKRILPLVRLIHSVATRLRARAARPACETRDRGPGRGQSRRVRARAASSRSGWASSSLAARSAVGGLMGMPPFTDDPEASRPHFARLAELAAEHGLGRLSMGTSQDWEVAVEEGATLIRLGTSLYR